MNRKGSRHDFISRVTCRIRGHDWDGCKCRRCGEWDRYGRHVPDEHCTCRTCGSERHDFAEIQRDTRPIGSTREYHVLRSEEGEELGVSDYFTDHEEVEVTARLKCRRCGAERTQTSRETEPRRGVSP